MTSKQRSLQFIFAGWLVLLFIPVIFLIPESELIFFRRETMFYICHQKLDRFFDIASHAPLVCARDIGIYLGLFLFNFFKIDQLKYKSLYFLIPFVLDKILEKIIGIDPGNLTRFISGLAIAVPIVVLIQYYLFKK